jgi:hypothetical protein
MQGSTDPDGNVKGDRCVDAITQYIVVHDRSC